MDGALACSLRKWSPQIGDPTLMGWLTVAAYAAAACLALVAALSVPREAPARGGERAFWLAAALALAFLSVNKQLDLQSFLTAYGRCLSQAQGWYEERRAVQRNAILLLIWTCLASGALLAWALRRTLRRTWLGLAGLVAVAAFVLVRAVGFHHVDALIGIRLGDARMNWVLELGGISLFAAGALLALLLGPGKKRR